MLTTKSHRPRLTSDHVPRVRLNRALDLPGDAPLLTLVVAPAGYGKSTCITAWLETLPATGDDAPLVAWNTLDDSDNELDVFVTYVIAAVQRAAPDALPGVARLLQAAGQPAVTQLADALAAGIEALSRRLVLVLDDYHVITAPAVHDLVGRLVRYSPANLRLIIISRVEPPVGVARLRARGQLVEIGAADLAFTPEEAAEFIGTPAGAPPEVSRLLYERTEGWAVGLRLGALSLRLLNRPGALPAALAERSQASTINYLLEEVLAQQPPGQVAYLLRTSILNRLQAELCAAVLDTDDIAACQVGLEFMERHNIFLIPLDGRHEWFRYHPQFQAMLQQRLPSRYEPAEIAAMHRRAAAWLAARGYLDEALSHDEAAGDVAGMADHVAAAVPRLANEDAWDALGRYLNRLPEAVVAARPALLVARAWHAQMRGLPAAVPPLLDRAEALLDDGTTPLDATTRDDLAGQIAALRGSGFFNQRDPAARRADLMRALDGVTREHHWARAYAFGMWAYVATTPAEEAAFSERIGAELAGAARWPGYQVRLLQALGFMQFRRGSLPEAAATAGRYAALAAELGMAASWAYGQFTQGMVRFYRGDDGETVPLLEAVLEHAGLVGAEVWLSVAYPLITLYAEQAGRPRCDALLARLDELLPRGEHAEETRALAAYAALANGDLATAARWADHAPHTPARYPMEARAIILARVRLAQRERVGLAQAGEVLDAYLEALAAEDERRQRVHALALRAQVHWERGEAQPATARLAEAIELGYARGMRRWFVAEGPVMGELLHALAREKRCAEAAGALLAQMASRHERRPPPTAAAVEPLSEREIDILEYLQMGLSNKEIAQRLRISPLTVRNHASNLYRKLGAASRRQAVARGVAVGLLRERDG